MGQRFAYKGMAKIQSKPVTRHNSSVPIPIFLFGSTFLWQSLQ